MLSIYTRLPQLIFMLFFLNNGVKSANLFTQLTAPGINIIPIESPVQNYKCDSHFNCSDRVFTLESYCCPTNGYCCNWFEFVSDFQGNKAPLPYKSPTLMTIITLLIILICFLFITYCFSIFFCYCFKCGLFKKPNLIVITEMSPSSNQESDSLSADLLSPKYGETSSSSTISVTSSSDSPFNRNGSNRSSRSKNKKNNKRLNQSYPSNISTAYSNSRRSPTARASSNGASSRLYAKPECYVDYDTESPFLIPTKSKSSNKRSSYNRSTSYSHKRSMPSAPVRSNSISHRRSAIMENEDERSERIESRDRSSSRASSLDIGETLIDVIETVNSENSVKPSAPYYLDEKPPSYDDIISGRK
ncbi:unnamed protein product [Brachionus calyciflorus]|uniref:Uncharacterized protein n=1 Tax=Brachionus calyciflorus TaxID=104777 RepID=A0A813MDZ0_9BILA|nr:unnamed protein product [Brachionus calyciflorus]